MRPTLTRMRFLAHPDRPLLISVLFWAGVATVVGVHLTHPGAAVLGPVPLGVALTLAVLLWPALPWRRGGGGRLVSIAFAVVTVLVAVTDGTGASLFLGLITFASLTLTYGWRAGVVAALAVSGSLGAAVVLVVHKSSGSAIYQAFGVLLCAAFVVALSTAINDARAARDRATRLIDELAAAHDELGRYAARVHTLAVAEERTRMARELHDTVGHHLTVIKVGLENAERYRAHDPEAAWQDVRQAKTLTVGALQEVRRGVRAMRPPALDGRRGADALRELARSFDGVGLTVEIGVDGQERLLDEAREILLFRVVQESLTNALRHSGGTAVAVRLGFTPGAVRLSIADDGKGAESAEHGFGLSSLAERVREAGGRLQTGDRDGGGFQVLVEMPEAV